ncbi:MAG TPA: Hsp33 family molecular chaperone HslO [Gallionellaceae bacterium]|nr:Hsp33 family molecular chaperone HslO [Gallionellaceae bacterium]
MLAEQGGMEVHCEFCNQRYEFDKVDAELIFVEAPVLPGSDVKH